VRLVRAAALGLGEIEIVEFPLIAEIRNLSTTLRQFLRCNYGILPRRRLRGIDPRGFR
jgi:hypothetical protein